MREAATLETALRGVIESYNFQLWTVTALFRLLGNSGCCPMDDPLLDQFQRSFSRGAENVAAALASTTAFVTAKRRESFLSHTFPSVTDAQKRKLLSDPLFDQKDLFAPASIEAAHEAARDFSLYRGAQSRPSTSSGSNQRRQLGMQILSVRFIAKPTKTRVVNLLNIIEEFLSSPSPPAALWRRLLGHLSSLTLLVKGGMLRMRSLQLVSGPSGTFETITFAFLGILCARRIFYGGPGRSNKGRE